MIGNQCFLKDTIFVKQSSVSKQLRWVILTCRRRGGNFTQRVVVVVPGLWKLRVSRPCASAQLKRLMREIWGKRSIQRPLLQHREYSGHSAVIWSAYSFVCVCQCNRRGSWRESSIGVAVPRGLPAELCK